MIKPIETAYGGCLFRSRLEARWAVFFDELGIKWVYEPEGYDLGELGPYLPDFFIPIPARINSDGYWIEVKPLPFDHAAQSKFARLCRETGHHGYGLVGLPGENPPRRFNHYGSKPSCRATEDFFKQFPVPPLSPLMLTRHTAFVAMCTPTPASIDDVARAIVAASSARFEHGQKGPRK